MVSETGFIIFLREFFESHNFFGIKQGNKKYIYKNSFKSARLIVAIISINVQYYCIIGIQISKLFKFGNRLK